MKESLRSDVMSQLESFVSQLGERNHVLGLLAGIGSSSNG